MTFPGLISSPVTPGFRPVPAFSTPHWILSQIPGNPIETALHITHPLTHTRTRTSGFHRACRKARFWHLVPQKFQRANSTSPLVDSPLPLDSVEAAPPQFVRESPLTPAPHLLPSRNAGVAHSWGAVRKPLEAWGMAHGGGAPAQHCQPLPQLRIKKKQTPFVSPKPPRMQTNACRSQMPPNFNPGLFFYERQSHIPHLSPQYPPSHPHHDPFCTLSLKFRV